MDRYLVLPFWLAGQHLAVALETVVRVLPALICTPLPGAPNSILGLVNVHGRLLPVANLAQRFAWPSAPASLWQPFLWLKTPHRELLIPVESVETVHSCLAQDFVAAPHPQVPSSVLKGVVRTAEGLLLIQDVEQVLCDADEECLAAALATYRSSDERG